MMADPIVNSGTSWGQGADSGTEPFYTPLDNPVSNFHGDYGIFPLSYISGIDLLGLGQDKRPWMSLDLLPERTFANGLKLFLLAMSRNPAGTGFLQTNPEHIAGGWGSTKAHSDQMATLIEIGRRFGDLLLHLERRDEVAVLGSLRQASLKGQSFARLWGGHFLATKAGYQATFVSERQCLNTPGLLAGYKAVVLIDMTAELTAQRDGVLYDALRRVRVAAATEAETLAWQADMTDVPGAYYLVAPRPLAALIVEASESVSTGGLFSLAAEAVDGNGKAFTGRLSVEVVLHDSAGRERYRLHRTTRQGLSLKIAANDPAGAWSWQVTEQATGLTATGTVALMDAQQTPSLTRAGERVYDAAAIQQALKQRCFEILIFPEQSVLLGQAEIRREQLTARGVACRVRVIPPQQSGITP